tara:strand:- start:305 stop:586 length:282 start_codon:yes stop_codon:yes gene_type:complete
MRHDAINNLYPEVHNQIDNECFDIKGNSVKVDEDKVKTEIARLKAEYEATEYQRSRASEYPTIQELVVALYDTDDKAAIEAKRAEVKKKYPKP